METKIAQQIRKNLRYRGYSKIAIAHTRKGGSDYYSVTAEDPITNHSISFGFHTVAILYNQLTERVVDDSHNTP